MIWSLVIVGVGQFLVAQVFSEVVAQYPVAGGVYPWARRLWGKKWAWMTGWVYLIALLATIASVTFGAGPYVAPCSASTRRSRTPILCALGLLVIATLINFGGTKALSYAAIAGFTAEIVGALVVGGWLLISHREQSFSVLFDTFGVQGDGGSYLPAFARRAPHRCLPVLRLRGLRRRRRGGPDPGIRIPKSMRRTIYIGGAAATFICLSLILSVTDINAVISGEDADPVGTILTDRLRRDRRPRSSSSSCCSRSSPAR